MIIKNVSKIYNVASLSRSKDYVMNEEKCIDAIDIENINLKDNKKDFFENQIDDLNLKKDLQSTKEINRLINYMSNEEKIKRKYISGYLCNVNRVTEDFMANIEKHMKEQGLTIDDADGILAYHFVQSFPEYADISDEEVHQCGIELVQKLGIYQAVITSHVHPEVDELSGVVKGKCKHNHILLSAYRHFDLVDEKYPDRMKYKYDTAAYKQLQIWNDQIALEHGLPIITEPDMKKTYSWYETESINQGCSWKERVRIDIDNTKRISNNWDEFIFYMKKNNYGIKEGKWVTYTTPDHSENKKQVVRDNTLGKEYTKDFIVEYFNMKKEILKDINSENDANKNQIDINEILKLHNEKLFIEIGISKSGKWLKKNKKEGSYSMSLELNQDLKSKSYLSYFKPDSVYNILNSRQEVVAQVTGNDIFNFYERKEKLKQIEDLSALEEQCKLSDTNDIKIDKQTNEYFNPKWVSSKTKKPYRVNVYNGYGRRRSSLELIILLSLSLINKESLLWTDYSQYNRSSKQMYAKRNWKLQNMMDSLSTIRKENITSYDGITSKIRTVGSKLNAIKRDINTNDKLINKMENLNASVDEYLAVKEICEQIYNMPKGFKKEEMKIKFQAELLQYNNSKSTLYRYKLTTDEQIKDFKDRYKKALEKREMLNEKYAATKVEYRKYKKIENDILLAANEQFSCGQEYRYDKAMNISEKEILEKEKTANEIIAMEKAEEPDVQSIEEQTVIKEDKMKQ